MLTTKTGDRLAIFDDGIIINYDLPKWKNAKKRASVKKSQATYATPIQNEPSIAVNGTGSQVLTMNSLSWNGINEVFAEGEPWDSGELSKVDFGEAAKMKIQDLTAFINKTGIRGIYGGTYSQWASNTVVNLSGQPEDSSNAKKKPGLLKRLFKREKPVTYEFSVLDFFQNVKLTGKNSAKTYKDRVDKYLSALSTATITGQVALKEKLAREMFVNKYEAELYANGLYYVVTENQVLDFARKTEKGVDLVYIKNFSRPLPDGVVEKLNKATELEVFDNYAVLCDDPDGKKKIETEKEREKRKDPILFGLIAGSDKLYYITDWTDEYCDLTLEQFVDRLQIEKADLKMK